MTQKYNKTICWSLNSAQEKGDLEAIREALANLGQSLPCGGIKEVAQTLATEEFMQWRSCGSEDAAKKAEEGNPTIAICDDKIYVILQDNTEDMPPHCATAQQIMENDAGNVNFFFAPFSDIQKFAFVSFRDAGSSHFSTHIAVPSNTYTNVSNVRMNFVHTNHVFEGWFNDAGVRFPTTTGKYAQFPRGSTFLHARYIPTNDACQVIFNANGGRVNNQPVPYRFIRRGSSLSLPTPTRSGSAFLGWFNQNGVRVTGINSTHTSGSRFTLTARWQSTLTFNANGGVLTPVKVTNTGLTGRTVTFFPTPRRDGHVFVGWFNSFGAQVRTPFVVHGNVTLWARWREPVERLDNEQVGEQLRPAGRISVPVLDLWSGKTFNIWWQPNEGLYHTDWSPASRADLEVIQSILHTPPNGHIDWSNIRSWEDRRNFLTLPPANRGNQWASRPGVITVWGRRIACGYHLVPHGSFMGSNLHTMSPPLYSRSNTRPANGWTVGGHMCMYYGNSAGGTNFANDMAFEAERLSNLP